MLCLLRSNDLEMTSRKLKEKEFHVQVAEEDVTMFRNQMGWTAMQTKYCQLITHKNRKVCIDWCLVALDMKETFHNVIFSDEISVGMCSSGRLNFFKKTSDLQQLPAKKQKPKHSYKNNDSKHKSKSTVSWLEAVGMMPSVMTTPASSHDINPIENVWSHMKHNLQHEVKPKKKDELVNDIEQFWEGLTAEKCARFIDHSHKILPYVVLNEGHPFLIFNSIYFAM